jgi:CheY-like chemotaxis protein
MMIPLKILIVDDDETILSLLEEVFSSDTSLEVTTLSDSEKAYRLLDTAAFDLIITDLMMPRVDGLKLLEKSLAVKPDALVVIVTGYASLETTLRAIHGGVYDYITKPFRIEEFRLLVHNAAARIRLMQQNRDLIRENAALRQQIEAMGKLSPPSNGRSREVPSELAPRPDSARDQGLQSVADSHARAGLSTYEKGLETNDERYDREIRHLEELFFNGRLTPEVFEAARQRLRTMI